MLCHPFKKKCHKKDVMSSLRLLEKCHKNQVMSQDDAEGISSIFFKS